MLCGGVMVEEVEAFGGYPGKDCVKINKVEGWVSGILRNLM